MSRIYAFFLKTKNQLLFAGLAAAFLAAAIWFVSPQQLPVIAYKLILAPLGGILGGWVWLAMLPYVNPGRFLRRDWRLDADRDAGPDEPDFPIVDGCQTVFCVCAACAALAFCAGMLAVAWGL
ncbi:MAG: putative holin [Deltaproteobacteria bacterium]|jgi:hypothetical protein|nr:putative holin [Deltaproteobacteria bacterium]